MDPLLHTYHGRRQPNGGRNPRSLPLILAAADYVRWLSDEPDPHDLLWSFPAAPIRIWPISKRVNKLENDDQSTLPRTELSAASRGEMLK